MPSLFLRFELRTEGESPDQSTPFWTGTVLIFAIRSAISVILRR